MYPKTKPCYVYDPITRLYIGAALAYLEPPFDEPSYLPPPNSVYVKPRGEPGPGRGYKLNEKGTGWLSFEDWTSTPLWSKKTAKPEKITVVGEKLPDTLTYDEPPKCTLEEYPRWDYVAEAWSIGPNNAGISWHTEKGAEGILYNPWDELPKDAIIGQSAARKMRRMRSLQKRLLKDANDLLEMCQEQVESHHATTGDSEILEKVNEYRRKIMLIDLSADPDFFVEPEWPVITFGKGDLLN